MQPHTPPTSLFIIPFKHPIYRFDFGKAFILLRWFVVGLKVVESKGGNEFDLRLFVASMMSLFKVPIRVNTYIGGCCRRWLNKCTIEIIMPCELQRSIKQETSTGKIRFE
jgi:hypothetical protein